jgi:transcription antitermination factor NusG
MSDWFVIQTAPMMEFKAAEALRDRGYTVFVPSVRARRRSGKRATVQAMFSRYLFIRYWLPWDECNARHPACIRDRAGRRMIIGPVTVCGRHEPIPESVIGKIAEAAARLDMEMEKPRRPLLKAGDIGIIRSGPMEGKSGEIVAIDRGEAEIALKIFNAIRVVKAQVAHLEAAE